MGKSDSLADPVKFRFLISTIAVPVTLSDVVVAVRHPQVVRFGEPTAAARDALRTRSNCPIVRLAPVGYAASHSQHYSHTFPLILESTRLR